MKKTIHAVLTLLFLSHFLFAEKFTFSADSMSGKTGEKNGTTVLTGNAYILTSTMEISADSITLSGVEYSTIMATGNVKGSNLESQMDFTCASLEYNRTTKIATLKGNVHLKDTENELDASASLIEYNSNTDIAVFQMDINIQQKDNTCEGSYAVYHKKEQFLELSGNAKVKQKDDTFRAQHIILNIETQEITMNGRVKGTVTDKSAEGKSAGENNQ